MCFPEINMHCPEMEVGVMCVLEKNIRFPEINMCFPEINMCFPEIHLNTCPAKNIRFLGINMCFPGIDICVYMCS